MARETDIEDLLFPVELQPLYTEIKRKDRLVKVSIPNSQVVINVDDGNPLGVVSKTYRVVTNLEAIELGKECCKELLGLDDDHGLEVFNAYAPLTKSYCHIDLVHHGFAMNLWDNATKPEVYLPYVRVTNSYNTTRSLRFDVGFCRELCLNGVIFETETVQFTFNHLRHELNKSIKFDIKKDQFKAITEKFKKTVSDLLECKIPRESARTVFDTVLGIPAESSLSFKNNREKAEYDNLLKYIEDCLEQYYGDMEANAYALFNAMTDFASRPPENRYVRRDTNSMQRSTGNWMHDFKAYLDANQFVADDYIKHMTQQSAKKVKTSTHNRGTAGLDS